MPQTSLALVAAGLLSGLVLSWPAELSAPKAHGLAGAPVARRAVTPAQDGAAGDAFDDVPVADDLAGCTPFRAIDGERQLDFDTEHGAVVETATPSHPLRSGGAPPPTRVGTFSTTDRTSGVVIVLAGVRREYTLIIPADGTQCILALGAPHAVNLERSWFGEAADGPDLDPPHYQQAAARPLQGGRHHGDST
jgi:hypothetical protein